MSPSPARRHQSISGIVYGLLFQHVMARQMGEIVFESDVRFSAALLYRPDIAFFAKGRVPPDATGFEVAPDLIVKVASPSTLDLDRRIKFGDYQQHGVREYWLIDPDTLVVHAFALESGGFVALPVTGDRLASRVIDGFTLDLNQVRSLLRG